MSRIFRIFFLVLCFSPFISMGQETAIKIVSELKRKGVDSEELSTITQVIGKDFYHIVEGLSPKETYTLINFRDDKMEYHLSGELMFVSDLDDWKLFQEEGELPYQVLKEHSSTTKMIKGREAMLIDLQMSDDETECEAWVDKKLFNQYKERYGLELTEGILEFSFSFDDVKIEYSTLSVEEVKVTEDFYTKLSHSAKEIEHKGEALLQSLDSLMARLQENEVQYSVESISVFQAGLARIQVSDTAFYINSRGEKVFDEIVDHFQPYSLENRDAGNSKYSKDEQNHKNHHFIVQESGRYRLVKRGGEPLHQGDYYKIEPRKLKGYLNVYDGKYMGIMDDWGRLLVPVRYEEASPLSSRYFLIKDKGSFGVYDVKKEDLTIDAQYEDVDYCGGCSNRFLLLKRNGKWGVLSLNGEHLLEFDFDHKTGTQYRFDRWISSFTKNGEKLLINLATGKILSTDNYDFTFILGDDIILYKEKGKFGLLNASGDPLIDDYFDFVLDRYLADEEDYILVYKRDEKLKAGILDQKGRWLLPIGDFEGAERFRNGFFSVRQEGKTGLLDQKQNVLLDLKYEFISAEVLSRPESKYRLGDVFSFSDFEKSGLYFVDTDRLLEPKYDEIHKVFNQDSTEVYFLLKQKDVSNEDLYELYDAKGESLISYEYDRIRPLFDDLFEIKKDNKYGIFGASQKRILVEPEYDFIGEFDESFLSLRQDGKQRLFHLPSRDIVLQEYSYFAKTNEENLWVIGGKTQGRIYDISTNEFVSRSFSHGNRSRWEFNLQLMVIGNSYTMGVINTKGEIIVPIEYSHIDVLPNGYLRLVEEISENKNKIYFADNNGELIHKEAFAEHPYYGEYEGDALVNNLLVTSDIDADGETVYGLMDLSGNEYVKPQYTNLQKRGDQGFITQVKSILNKKYKFTIGLLNNHGEEIIPPVLESVIFDIYNPFPDSDTVPVKVDRYYFYIDQKGEILPFISQELGGSFL